MIAQTTTMDALHDAIVADLRAAFGDEVQQVGAYEPWDPMDDAGVPLLQTPALLVQVESFDLATDPDPFGRAALLCTLAVHCVLSLMTERLQQTLPQLAARVAMRVQPPLVDDQPSRANHWGLGPAVEDPAAVTAQPGEFAPGLHGRDSWLVRWEQIVYLEG